MACLGRLLCAVLPLDTTRVTPPGQPWLIVYDVWDYYGNQAASVNRSVEIFDPCLDRGEIMCDASRTCSVAGNCNRAVLTFLGQISSQQSTLLSDVTSAPASGGHDAHTHTHTYAHCLSLTVCRWPARLSLLACLFPCPVLS